MPILITLDQTV